MSGAYAETRVIAADRLVRLPSGIDDRTAAAMMLKGMTAEFLLLRCVRAARGDTVLFHAAAGGVGSIACQWAQAIGLKVIGTAGGPDKVARARQNGCDEVIDIQSEDFVARVKELTGGAGVRAVFDSVGKETVAGSLDCLATRGMLVLFGQSSGVVPPIDPARLAAEVAVLHAPLAHPLRGDARGAGAVGGAPVRSGGAGRGADRRRADLRRCATRRRRTAISRGARRPVRPSSCLEPLAPISLEEGANDRPLHASRIDRAVVRPPPLRHLAAGRAGRLRRDGGGRQRPGRAPPRPCRRRRPGSSTRRASSSTRSGPSTT